MKKTLQVLALTAVLVFAFATVASAKYASYDNKAAYLSWNGANALYNKIGGTTGMTQTSPHGGYTQTSVKCAICHSTHRAFSGNTVAGVTTERTTAGLGDNYTLTSNQNACAQCHASWGSNPSAKLVEIGQVVSGPHIGASGSTCTGKECHGSVHGMHASKYAAVRLYNLTNYAEGGLTGDGQSANIDGQLDRAIAAGNVNSEISLTSVSSGMKAFVTGYTCSPCHNNSQFAVATIDETNGSTNTMYAGIVQTSAKVAVAHTGHPSAGGASYVPTCEACHDLVGSNTNTTAFPHANRGINVYGTGRYNYEGSTWGDPTSTYASVGNIISTDNTVTTQYGLWMTSGVAGNDAAATPIVGVSTNGFNLQDGACIKCHKTDGSAYALP